MKRLKGRSAVGYRACIWARLSLDREQGKQRSDALVEALVGEQSLVICQADEVELVTQHVGIEAQTGEVGGGAQAGVQIAIVEQGFFEVGHIVRAGHHSALVEIGKYLA